MKIIKITPNIEVVVCGTHTKATDRLVQDVKKIVGVPDEEDKECEK